MQKQWDFTLTGDKAYPYNEVRMSVDPASGHWSDVLDTETMQVTRTVYVYEAYCTASDGKRWDMPVLGKTITLLRKKAKQAAAQVAP